MTFQEIQEKNRNFPVIHADTPGFSIYGKVLPLDTSAYLEYVRTHLPIPEKVAYVPLDAGLMENVPAREWLENNVFGQMPVEVGYCAGHNRSMNAMEWHHSPEVNIAVTDTVLFLAGFSSIRQAGDSCRMHSRDVTAVFVPRGYAIALHPLVLHFTPISVEDGGFFTLVVLQQETNLPLKPPVTDPYLKAKNKWLLFHRDCGQGDNIDGENLTLF